MAEAIAERVRRYILDGSDEDLRRLLGVAESTREMARSAFRRVGMQEGWHVIDCGCGPIGGLAVMAEMAGPAGRVVGVDFSEPAIQRARSVAAAARLKALPVATLCDLAHAWWHDRLAPDWRPHTRGQNQAILDGVGLTGEFWRLP